MYKAPNNTSPLVFHRKYAVEMAVQLGTQSPSLPTWYSVGVQFLKGKLLWPRALPNDFRWYGFPMCASRIKAAVAEATYQFGMVRMGYVED